MRSTNEHPDNSTVPQTIQVPEVPPSIVTSDLLSLRSCTIFSLHALTVPHIHIVHIIFSITTLAMDTELAFHSSKVYRDMLLLASKCSVIKSDNSQKLHLSDQGL